MSTTDALPTRNQIRDLVKESGLDWHRGFMPLFDGDDTNRYEALVSAALAAQAEEVARITAERDALRVVVQRASNLFPSIDDTTLTQGAVHELRREANAAIDDAARTGSKP